MKNKYAKRSRVSEAKIRDIVRHFAIDRTALQAAVLSGMNRNTVNRYASGTYFACLLGPAPAVRGDQREFLRCDMIHANILLLVYLQDCVFHYQEEVVMCRHSLVKSNNLLEKDLA